MTSVVENLQKETGPIQDRQYTLAFTESSPMIPVNAETLGNKGLKLVELTQMGLPVPEGFIITTYAWRQYVDNNHTIPPSLWTEITDQIHDLEEKTGSRLGDPQQPLFVSARSGAAVSMPGAMDTILNLGITPQTIDALRQEIGDEAAGQARQMLRHIFTAHDEADSPINQLRTAISRIFDSWDNDETKAYRQQHNIPDTLGTAVTIQRMVWGNSGKEGAGSGVILTRDPHAFSDLPVVEFAPHAQGLAVVGEGNDYQQKGFEELPLTLQEEITNISDFLEHQYNRPQDIEFTHDGTKLWLLQTRDAPISPLSWFRFLNHMVHEGNISPEKVERLISTAQLHALLVPDLDPDQKQKSELLATGLPISLGNASGRAITTMEQAQQYPSKPVILAATVSQKDLQHIPKNVVGIAAVNGSIGSHISRIAVHVGFERNMPIVFGAQTNRPTEPGEYVTIDGATGELFAGIIDRLPNGTSQKLTIHERTVIEALLKQKLENPWAYMTEQSGIDVLTDQARYALEGAREAFRSPKAHEIAALNSVIPATMAIEYNIVVQLTEIGSIKARLIDILTERDDATIRTCHTPPRPGGSPWAQLTKVEDIDRLFTDPTYSKYGGFSTWTADSDLTEVIVGRIPKDKLNPAPEIQRQHCAWTLICTDTGVVLQISPFSSQLRGFEGAQTDDLVTIQATYNPSAEHLDDFTLSVGTSLQENQEALAFAQFVGETVLGTWWYDFDLPKRMAALSNVFPQPQYSVPVLEGQARIKPDGTTWCKIYGVKTDKQE